MQQLSDRDVIRSLYLSQGIILVTAVFCFVYLPKSAAAFSRLWQIDFAKIVGLGFFSALIIVLLESIIDRIVPEKWTDDGGTNARVFQALSYPHILLAMAVVALSEELLFRGAIQTQFGFVIASLVFAVVHVRYLKKPLLFISACAIGFYLGWLFMIGKSLLVGNGALHNGCLSWHNLETPT
ncbi:CPBP family intramembrane metalloprotease [Terrilactibacillus sp. S3-3]|nr:CPBP family intramembrane metalloprotease [Terrilactibacillus sp. S3-3]